jgi:hypothetical protein
MSLSGRWLVGPRAPHYRAVVELFPRCWAALRAVVAGVPDADFARPSGCAVRLCRDLVCQLVIDAQDVPIPLATPVDAAPTRDAATYGEVTGAPPAGDDPLDALTVRLAAAYRVPGLLKFHLDDVGRAAGRAAGAADPGRTVGTRGQVRTVDDCLGAYVPEWPPHHLDRVAHLSAAPGPDGAARDRLGPLAARLSFVLGPPAAGQSPRASRTVG